MPAKNRIKIYQENSYYHIYNRGVAKQSIFLDKQDYHVFLSFLKTYLCPKNKQELQEQLAQAKNWQEKLVVQRLITLPTFSKQIKLLAYCLMPNHFHFLVKQKPATAIRDFIRSLATRYSMYFNKKYNRVGSVFQGRYKAVLIKSDNQLLHLSRYIHLNPNPTGSVPVGYRYSSLSNYLGTIKQIWVKPNEILSFFSNNHSHLSYKTFISKKQETNPNLTQDITLD